METPRIKVYGCGSAGMHLTHAARVLGWHVDMVDVDHGALQRVPHMYRDRYGGWDTEDIGVYHTDKAPTGDYDICIIATPPAYHISTAIEAWEKHDPHAVLIEKPLCAPGQTIEARALFGTRTFVGYTHLMSAGRFNLRRAGKLEVDFREAWRFVLNAHPWNTKPEDTYLGDWRAGGGACSEHSHAINLWEYYARPEHGEVVEVSAYMSRINGYDSTAMLHLKTEDDFTGVVVMDTIRDPAIKVARAVGSDGSEQMHRFGACDFTAELLHIYDIVMMVPGTSMFWTESPLAFEKGWRTAKIIEAAHRSMGNPVCLDV